MCWWHFVCAAPRIHTRKYLLLCVFRQSRRCPRRRGSDMGHGIMKASSPPHVARLLAHLAFHQDSLLLPRLLITVRYLTAVGAPYSSCLFLPVTPSPSPSVHPSVPPSALPSFPSRAPASPVPLLFSLPLSVVPCSWRAFTFQSAFVSMIQVGLMGREETHSC